MMIGWISWSNGISVHTMAVLNRTRWIAGTTGCVTAVTGLPLLGVLSPAVSGLLIVGAALGRRLPRHASVLMWVGAGLITFWAVPIWIAILNGGAGSGASEASAAFGSALVATSAAICSILLVLVGDAALLTEVFCERRTTND